MNREKQGYLDFINRYEDFVRLSADNQRIINHLRIVASDDTYISTWIEETIEDQRTNPKPIGINKDDIIVDSIGSWLTYQSLR